jgi:hypothetical protein
MSQYRIARLAALGVVLAAAGASPSLAAHMGYTLADDGRRLVIFNIATGDIVAQRSIVGATRRLDDLDFRPATGQLFGYDDKSDQYYMINTVTGFTTDVTVAAPATDTRTIGIDWNPTIDRMRTVTVNEGNIVYNPNTMTATNAGIVPLFYGPMDVNAGANPSIVGNGYTNSIAGAATTVQYVLDSDLNNLATLANNAGTLTTVGTVTIGGMTLDFGDSAGFDIFFTLAMTNIAYALLNVEGVSRLYTIDLATAVATFVADVGIRLDGLAVGVANDVPEPGLIGLFGLGALGVLAARRRRA